MEKLVMNELMQKNIKELVQLRKDLKSELYTLRMKNSMRALRETHTIKLTRRNIARVNTALHRKIHW